MILLLWPWPARDLKAEMQAFSIGADTAYETAFATEGLKSNVAGLAGGVRGEWRLNPLLGIGLGYCGANLNSSSAKHAFQYGSLEGSMRLSAPRSWAGLRPFALGSA